MSDPASYTVGWVCALMIENIAARQSLDEEHDTPDSVSEHDNNTYTLGRIGKHRVVIASLPDGEYGIASATAVARDMLHSFPNIRIGLLVGIGGGAPSGKHDIRLGDVVVSSPRGGQSGILQYDYGKAIQGLGFQHSGFLNQPQPLLRTAVSDLRARYLSDGNQIHESIQSILAKKKRLRRLFQRPEPSTDRLYRSTFVHADENKSCSDICSGDANEEAGVGHFERVVKRIERSDDEDNPTVHYGLIASANTLMKNAEVRDCFAEKHDVLCFEMEAAGLMNHFPCLVIRGICDYSDTHKNKDWQGYAAITAATYAKDLLGRIPPKRVEMEKRVGEVLSIVNRGVDEIRTTTQETNISVRNAYTEHHRDKIISWLSASDPSTNLNKALQQRHQGSGQWFLQSPTYLAWKIERNSFLWLYGIPGCGKTILSSSIIADLEGGDTYQKPLYFFFDFSDNQKQSLENAVRSLVIQLYIKRQDTQSHLDSQYSHCGSGFHQPSITTLCKMFQKMVQQVGEVWIVLDALDECQMRTSHPAIGLILWVKGLLGSSEMNVHLLVTSRPEEDIYSAIKTTARTQDVIHIQSNLVAEDIREYVHTRVRKHQGLSRWQSRPEVQDEIDAAIIKNANGMFRWVSCQLDALEECIDYQSLRRALGSLPRTLDETYDRILENVPDARKHFTTRILQFLAFSERPLRIDEAIDAIVIQPKGKPRFDPKDRLPVPTEIIKCCSSLVILVTREINSFFEGPSTVTELQLAHFSVKEYLTSDRLGKNLALYFHEQSAKASLAKVCLAYLSQLDYRLPVARIRELFPLAQYCAQYWIPYALGASSKDEEVQDFILEALLNPEKPGPACFRLYSPDKPLEACPGEPAPGLYYASFVGLEKPVEHLLRRGLDVNIHGGWYHSSLQAASYKGYEKIVRILLENNVDVNAQGGRYGNALQAASQGGHIAIVQLLLENGAKINATGGHYGSALQAACQEGHEDVAELLLQKHADVNIPGGQFGNPVQAASYSGHKNIVRMLIRKGANLNSDEGEFGSPLLAASYYGHEEIVQILLEHNARVDVVDEEVYGSALHCASLGGYERIAQRLIEKGADVNLHGGKIGYALQCASVEGHETTVLILLDNGADINALGGDYGTAVQAASYGGHERIVRILIDKGADIHGEDGKDGSALEVASLKGHEGVADALLKSVSSAQYSIQDYNVALRAASWGGNERIVWMLLNRGANVNAEGKKYGQALQTACEAGHKRIIQVLLEKGANVNAQGGHHGNALQTASYSGYDEIVQILLEKGANVNAQGGRYGNALQAASYKGSDNIVQILLDNGASVNTQGGEYGNALQAALQLGHEKVVQTLLKKGANVNAQGGLFGNALQTASFRGYEKAVQALLEKGADIDARGGVFGNALQAASFRGHEKVVQMLIEKGADVKAWGGRFETSLRAASCGGHEKVVQILLEKGADSNSTVYGEKRMDRSF